MLTAPALDQKASLALRRRCPFVDLTRPVEQSEGAGARRERSHRQGCEGAGVVAVESIRIETVAPGEIGAVRAARRFFPLDFAG